jgi:hypothetical protein
MTGVDPTEKQLVKGAHGGRRKGSTEYLERVWDEIQARTRKGLGWKPFDAQKALGEANGQADQGVDNPRSRHTGHWFAVGQLG